METDYPRYGQPQATGWQPLNAVQSDDPATTTDMRLGFRVGSLGFVLPIHLHCEVVERPAVSLVPNVEPWFSGLLNIRGNIVPVVDLHLLLGQSASPDPKRCLFAIDRGDKTMALWIDGYPRMLADIEPLEAFPALPEPLQAFVAGAYAHDGQPWLNVRFEHLFKTLGRRHAARDTA